MYKKEQSSILFQLTSRVLLLLFLGIYLVQAIHIHKQVRIITDNRDGHKFIPSAEQCKICDYFTHSQKELFDIAWPLTLLVQLPVAIEIKSRLFGRIYKFTLQGFTNKGPPNIIA